MKYLYGVVCSFLLGSSSLAQDEAYYIGTMGEADLLHVHIQNGKPVLGEVYSFTDTVQTIHDRHHELLLPFWSYERMIVFDSIAGAKPELKNVTTFTPQYRGVQTYSRDSILVDGKWYFISEYLSDDGYIGGRPNQVNKQIFVGELGVIYSSANFIGGHLLLMLCHSNDQLQQVLLQVYAFLDREKQPWYYWDKCIELSSASSFSTALPDLTKRWFANRNDLRLVNNQMSYEGTMVYYSATIRNVSQTRYYFPKRTLIAPSKALITYSNGLKEEWNLLETTYGSHFKQLDQSYYLDPGDTIRFTHDFLMDTGGSYKTMAFKGFQLYPRYRLLMWLVAEPSTHNGKKYVNFPYREVKF